MKRFDRRRFSRNAKRSAPDKGLVIYYFGDGKGKTTAAVGLAVRAAGAGKKVGFLQFMKSLKWKSHERNALARLGIPVRVMGSGFVGIIDDKISLSRHKDQARTALNAAKRMLRSGNYDVFIADEAVSAVDEKLLTVNDIVSLIKVKPPKTHVVITGHSEYKALEKASDLVTDMRNIKHPFHTQGILAQPGIDY